MDGLDGVVGRDIGRQREVKMAGLVRADGTVDRSRHLCPSKEEPPTEHIIHPHPPQPRFSPTEEKDSPTSTSRPFPLLKNHPQRFQPQRKRIPALAQQASTVFPVGEAHVETGDEERDHGAEFHFCEFFADATVWTCREEKRGGLVTVSDLWGRRVEAGRAREKGLVRGCSRKE